MKVEKDSALRLLSNYKIGIYYPNDVPDLAKVANDIRSKLGEYTLKKVRIELHPEDQAPLDANGRPNGYEIRYAAGYEDEAADTLYNILKETYPTWQFKKVTAGNRTENFLSIFLGL